MDQVVDLRLREAIPVDSGFEQDGVRLRRNARWRKGQQERQRTQKC